MYKNFSIFALALLIGCVSCRKDRKSIDKTEEILVIAGDSALTVSDVVRMIPRGLSEEDSTALFHTVVDRWVRNMVLSEVASSNLYDKERIDRMVEDYRNDLIVDSYLTSMTDKRSDVDEEEIKKYYISHVEEMKLPAPIVKGIFVKVPEKDERLSDLRRWMKSPNGDAVDNIEKYGLRNASRYEYFMDRWIDWEDVAEQIPYRFFDADAFLQSTKDFETAYGGSTYLLHISEYCLSGEKMPYEYASGVISGILSNGRFVESRNNLIKEIYREKMSEGSLKGELYDPITGKMKKSPVRKTDEQKNRKKK